MENSGSDSRETPGAGCGASTSSEEPATPITINISTTTGGNFTQTVETHYSVENLKKIVAKKLRVAKDRICLLHRERELQEGTLKENGIVDGSRIILTPNVETGLLAQRPESTVMQALESLNDSQVNDFLSGKSPLNLNMRLGDHMMIIQLQLSTVNPPSSSQAGGSGSSGGSGSRSRNSRQNPANAHKSRHHHYHHHYHHHHYHHRSGGDRSTSGDLAVTRSEDVDQERSKHPVRFTESPESPPAMSTVETVLNQEQEPMFNVTTDETAHSELAELMKQELDDLLTNIHDRATTSTMNATDDDNNAIELDQSPIKSLSNLVSSPIISVPIPNYGITPAELQAPCPPTPPDIDPTPSTSSYPDPIAAKLTSCLCKRLDSNSNSNAGCDVNCQQQQPTIQPRTEDLIHEEEMRPSAPVPPEDFEDCHMDGGLETLDTTDNMLPSTSSTNATTQTKSWRSSSWMHKTANNPITKIKNKSWNAGSSTTLRSAMSSSDIKVSRDEAVDFSTTQPSSPEQPPPAATPTTTEVATIEDQVPNTGTTTIDARALAEASRNLTQTLKKLSKEVFTSKVDLAENSSKKIGTGAVIESMKHHGKGIYSGTFSGTLNPALQDRYGRPKRDISTIIHILNDLLSATPQYRRGTSISVETGSSSSSSRTSSRQSSSRRHHHQTSEMCSKCSKTSRNCPYGECSGHYAASTSMSSPSASTSASPTSSAGGINLSLCKHSREDSHHHAWSCGSAGASASTSSTFDGHEGGTSSTTSSIRASEESMDTNNSSGASTSKSSSIKCCCQSSMAPICSKCSGVELENNKTKVKLDQLKLVMQQKKERREARKLKSAPYSATIQGASVTTAATALAQLASTTTTTAAANVGASGAAGAAGNNGAAASATNPTGSDVPQSHIVEEVDTAA